MAEHTYENNHEINGEDVHNGGKTYAFSDPNYPLMAGVAGADLQNDLKNPQGAIRKNVDAGVAQAVDKAGLKPVDKKSR